MLLEEGLAEWVAVAKEGKLGMGAPGAPGAGGGGRGAGKQVAKTMTVGEGERTVVWVKDKGVVDGGPLKCEDERSALEPMTPFNP